MHRINETESILHPALSHELLYLVGNVDIPPPLGDVEPQFLTQMLHKLSLPSLTIATCIPTCTRTLYRERERIARPRRLRQARIGGAIRPFRSLITTYRSFQRGSTLPLSLRDSRCAANSAFRSF